MSTLTIELATLTPHEARGIMALLSHIAIHEQEVKPAPKHEVAIDTDRIVEVHLVRATGALAEDQAKVEAENHAALVQTPDEPKAKRGRPKKTEDSITTTASATATDETATPAAPVDQAPEQSPAPAAGAPQAPEASASTSSDQGPDLAALKNALGHVMQHKGGSQGALDLLERFGCRRISEVAELSAAKRAEFVKLAMSADAAEVA